MLAIKLSKRWREVGTTEFVAFSLITNLMKHRAERRNGMNTYRSYERVRTKCSVVVITVIVKRSNKQTMVKDQNHSRKVGFNIK